VAASAPRSGLTVGVVAGEASGDNLGAALIEALRERVPGVRFVGVAGPRMRAAGCEVLADADELALMGLTEILRHLPRLFALRRRVRDALLALRPDVFVGIDAPEFNLGLERQLKAAGLRTVQYVSPQVWAWRQGRVRTIGRSTDLVLCLLPFEPKFYAEHGVRAQFVGHPLADQFPAIAASDAVLLSSGTATLETALVKRPMVVAYRVAPLTGWLLRDLKLVKTEFFSQPNLLAGRALVPEFFQEQVRPEVLGPAVLAQLERPDHDDLIEAFEAIHASLRRDASERAAEAVLELLAARRPGR
jgi:lipid A disaccharide synthetase